MVLHLKDGTHLATSLIHSPLAKCKWQVLGKLPPTEGPMSLSMMYSTQDGDSWDPAETELLLHSPLALVKLRLVYKVLAVRAPSQRQATPSGCRTLFGLFT